MLDLEFFLIGDLTHKKIAQTSPAQNTHLEETLISISQIQINTIK